MTTSHSIALEFGLDTRWEIDGSKGIDCHLEPAVQPCSDLAEAIDQALSNPVDFPSLDQATVPGDTLVFPVDVVVPNLAECVPLILKWFVDHGTSPHNISIVLAGGSVPGVAAELSANIESTLGESVTIEMHDPDDEDGVAYVAANQDADPIYMNRRLVDADVVIPITCCRSTTSLDYLGAYSIYPLLSDRTTRGAFYRFGQLADKKSHERLTQWADQAARWAGFMVEIQVLPAGRNQIAAVLAGATEPLEAECTVQMNNAWETPVQQSDLTIALLDGGEAQQNWLGISRALHAAQRCTNEHGAIVVCTQAKETLGKSIRRLKDAEAGSQELEKKLAKDTSDDAIAASLMNHIITDKHVYLVSEMRVDTLESLGVGSISQPSELEHLIDQFATTTVLGSAQHRHIVLN